MIAYHNNPAIKAQYLARVRQHRLADELVKGRGWENGKGCAIGCTLENYDHARYPIELGIPEMLARLEDTIFEGLPNAKAQLWPERFLRAIKPGTDLSRVGWKFMLWLITDSGICAYDHPSVKDAIAQVAEVLRAPAEGRPVDVSAAWSAAESAARSAARSAESAARSAAESAARSAESAAWSAAESAERSAESAAWSAESAAWSAAESAARSAARSAESAAYVTMADQLIKLLREASHG